MKKIILLALIAVIMAGCYDQTKAAKEASENDFGVTTIDSCEYILRIGVSRGYLAHKGNCRFCKERRQKELEELAKQLKRNNYGIPQ